VTYTNHTLSRYITPYFEQHYYLGTCNLYSFDKRPGLTPT